MRVQDSSIPAEYQHLLKFNNFNKLQTATFDKIYNQTDNIIVKAPTGSGKTALFELEILKHLDKLKTSKSNGSLDENNNHIAEERTPKVFVYFAPLRAICSQIYKNWQKFTEFGINVLISAGEESTIQDFLLLLKSNNSDSSEDTIIITTPEKFSQITSVYKN